MGLFLNCVFSLFLKNQTNETDYNITKESEVGKYGQKD